jgi:hypothetical protein
MKRIFRFAVVVIAVLSSTVCVYSHEYEIDGNIELRLFRADRSVWKVFNGNFRVFVDGRQWLIQSTEVNDFGIPLRREVGTTNGTELFETVKPYQPFIDPPIAETLSISTRTNSLAIRPMAFAVPNGIPVGTLDSSFVGHLWLMFASGSYFASAESGKLTPVYDYSASALGDPSLQVPASWESLNGPEALPSKVVYYGSDLAPVAIYSVSETTNIGTLTVPTRFKFDQPKTHYKEVNVAVNSVRGECSRQDFKPKLGEQIVIADFRWSPEGARPREVVCYDSSTWLSVQDAKSKYLNIRTKYSGTVSNNARLIVILLLILPGIRFAYKWFQWQRK